MSLSTSMLFDAHAHLISDDWNRYPPAPLSGQLHPWDRSHPLTVERLLADMDACGVERAVLVQRTHVYGFDNSYVCDAARAHADRLTAVAAVDAREPDAAKKARYWVIERGAAGIRLMEPHKGADTSWFAGENARGVWQVVARMGVPMCVHFFRWNRAEGLPVLQRLLVDFPDVPVVIDHFSNMVCESGPPDYGVDGLLLEVARLPNAYTKFTTIPLGQLAEQGVDSAEVVRRVLDAFGARRVMWGSDIAQSRGSYSYMIDLAHAATSRLSEDERRQVLYGTTEAVYGRMFR